MEKDVSSRPLLKVVPITSRLTLTYLLGKAYVKLDDQAARAIALPFSSSLIPIQPKKSAPERIRKNHSHSNAIYLIHDFCRPIGRAKWLTVGFVAPSIIWRIQSLLHSVEAREVVVKAVVRFEQQYSNTVNLAGESESSVQAVAVAGIDSVMEVVQTICVTDDSEVGVSGQNLTVLTVPNASTMLETLTPRLAKENLDSERLELLGDSLLKLVTSVEIYRIYPAKHEGFLTSQRSKVISNLHLTEMCQKLGLDRYLRAVPLSSGKQQLIVRPPGMAFNLIREGLSLWNENLVVKRTLPVPSESQADVKSVGTTTVEDDQEIASDELCSNKSDRELAKEHLCAASFFQTLYPVPGYEQVEVKSKTLADVMEAIFGGFYVEGGLKSGVTAIKALGCWPVFDAQSAARVKERTRYEMKMHKWTSSMVIRHTQEEQVDFPEDFPMPLRRIALGITIDLGGCTEEGSSFVDQVGPKMNGTVATPERSNKDVNNTDTSLVASGENDVTSLCADNAPARTLLVTQATVDAIARAMGYRFKNWNILEEALTHCSVQYKRSNQRMEFLGDAILDFTVVSLLYKSQPWARQGDLSSQKSIATSNKNLGQFGARLQLYRYLNRSSQQLEAEFSDLERSLKDKESHMFSKKQRIVITCEQASCVENDPKPNALSTGPDVIEMGSGASKALADTFEALVGAIYLDCLGEMDDLYTVVKHINLLPQLDVL